MFEGDLEECGLGFRVGNSRFARVLENLFGFIDQFAAFLFKGRNADGVFVAIEIFFAINPGLQADGAGIER